MEPSSPNQPYAAPGAAPPPGQPQPGAAGPAFDPTTVDGHQFATPGYAPAAAPSMNAAQMQGQAMPAQPGVPPQPQQAPAGVGAPVTGGGPAQPTTRPVRAANPNSTQNSLLIAEIRDGIVIMSDGSFRSVIMVKSINFDLMSQAEQEAVEYSYQGFLNSLYFPIQIFVRSQKVDLQPYVERLDKIRTEHENMLLALLMEDYIAYIDALAQQTNIMDKMFYIIIPYFPHVAVQKALTQSKTFFTGIMGLLNNKDQHVVINEADLETAKNELRNRVQVILSGLLQCGVQALPLDTQELIELYYDTYNPDTATRQQLKNFNDLNADVIRKGAGRVPQAHLQRELG